MGTMRSSRDIAGKDIEIFTELPAEKQDYVKSRKWYHQRFDGCPHFLIPVGYGEARKEERKPPGTEATYRCVIMAWGKSDWYLLEDDNERTTKLFLEKSKEGDASFTASLMEEWADDEKGFYEICSEVDGHDLSKLSKEELLGLHGKFMEGYIRRCTSSSIIDGFALYSDRIIADKIHGHLKSIGRDAEYDKVFSVLTAPVHLSFTNEAELSLLNVASEVKKNAELAKLFMEKGIDGILMKISDFDIDWRISEHQRNYFWVHNNYNDAFVLTEEYFIGEIKKLLLEGIDIEHEFNYIKGHPQMNKQTKEKLIEELKLPPEIRALIRYSEDFTHWQDERKRSTFFATHYLSLLITEIGKRADFPLEELKYLLPNEVGKVFNGKITREELKKRMKGCVALFGEKDAYITADETAISGLRSYFDSMNLPTEEISVIKGLPASLGKAKGKVKVLRSAREIKKVEKGDILVAVMTRPDYVIAMKKAAAIVTDEGGITCHAAIVARELRIPCVIATKFATKALKDGDVVEVDADKGEVKIIR